MAMPQQSSPRERMVDLIMLVAMVVVSLVVLAVTR
jgi:hypothetical protein